MPTVSVVLVRTELGLDQERLNVDVHGWVLDLCTGTGKNWTWCRPDWSRSRPRGYLVFGSGWYQTYCWPGLGLGRVHGVVTVQVKAGLWVSCCTQLIG